MQFAWGGPRSTFYANNSSSFVAMLPLTYFSIVGWLCVGVLALPPLLVWLAACNSFACPFYLLYASCCISGPRAGFGSLHSEFFIMIFSQLFYFNFFTYFCVVPLTVTVIVVVVLRSQNASSQPKCALCYCQLHRDER